MKKRDLRNELIIVMLAVLQLRAIPLSTTAPPPISSTPHGRHDRKLDGNQAASLVVRLKMAGGGGAAARDLLREGERRCSVVSSGPCRGTGDTGGHGNTGPDFEELGIRT